MNQITAPAFREPSPQPELGGELGLTSEDVAAALGAQHQHVTARIVAISEMIPGFHATARKVMTGGRPKIVYTLPVDEAKIIVAKYDNEKGMGYLRFLIQCERVATKLTPELVAKVADLEAQLVSMRARLETTARPRALPPPKTALVTELVTRHESLMGDGEVLQRHMVRVQRAGLTELDLLKARRVNLILQSDGVATAIRNTQDRIDFLEQSPAQRIALAPKIAQ